MSKAHIALIEAIQASWSDPDPEAFVSLFTEDGLFEDKSYAIAVRGHEQLRAHARRVQKHNVGLKVEILTCDATERTGVAEWQLSHIFTGKFDGVDCTGRPIEIQGLSLYEFTDNRISRAADYWNYMEIIRCVGVLPRELRGLRVS
jgi:steroid delta-isomerase-like uncharacterized protein